MVVLQVKLEPLAVILVVARPAAGLSEIVGAPAGGLHGVGEAGGDGDGDSAATSTNHRGTKARILRSFMTGARKGTGSDRGPGDRPGGRGLGEAPGRVEHAPQSPLQELHLVLVQKRLERGRQLALAHEIDQGSLDVAAEGARQRLAGKV